jgi:3-deoxy-D-manno-octulosonic-acid transferase
LGNWLLTESERFSMKWLIYNLLFGFAYLLMLPKFVFRMMKRGGYARNFLQRIGLYSDEIKARLVTGGRIWVHAVSVGEMGVAIRVMEELRLHNPDLEFIVSTNTSTAHTLAEKKLNSRDVLVYFPLDCTPVIARVAKLVRPKMLMLTECELWPNLIRRMHKDGVPIVLYNGRLSDSSYKGYLRTRFFFNEVVGLLDSAMMQGEEDRRRLIDLGADESKVTIEGTVKYDMSSVNEDGVQAGREILRGMGLSEDDLVLVGGSTWPGEEAILADVYKRLKEIQPGLKMVIVPRHAERRQEVSSALESAGLTYLKKTDLDGGASVTAADVLLADTTGEIKSFYALADIVFVGKSLTDHGGQNFIEPAMYAKPIVVGPNLENFPVVAKEFLDAKAMIQVQDAAELEKELVGLLEDSGHRRSLGERAGGLIKVKSGAVRRIADKVLSML